MSRNRAAYSAKELADIVNGKVIGDFNKSITGVAGVLESNQQQITFAENSKYLKKAEKSNAGVIIVPEDLRTSNKTIISVKNPRLAYAKIASIFAPEVFYKPGIHPSAIISENATIGSNVSIHPQVVIDDNVVIADNTVIAPGAYIGKGVQIGSNTVIHPNVVIEYNSIIGSNVIIHGGTVIGSDGYGFVSVVDGHHKIPQLGNVIIEDNVEIGANVTVDRGTSGSTVIGKGTKVDNLVQIAHNVKIGPDCLIIAQVGIAGSTELGKRVTLAGKTGVIGHIKVADNVTVASYSLVTKNTPSAVFYSGNPAHDHKEELREQAALRRLPELLKKVKKLEKKILQMEGEKSK